MKYLNNIGEQDLRFIKKRVHSMLGLKYFQTATYIIYGIEAMYMVKKTICFIDQVCPKSSEAHLSNIWIYCLRLDFTRKLLNFIYIS